MNKLNPKPIEIINAVIAEIYGKQAVDLLKFFSKLNEEGKFLTVEYAEMSANSDRYKKAIPDWAREKLTAMSEDNEQSQDNSPEMKM